MELVIDRGVKSYDVKDVDGTLLGVIKINPADIGISGRFVSARNAIAELAEQAKQDMTPEKILAMDTTIKAELNKVFGSDVSSVFFGGLSALALADDGAFVFEKVLEAVAPLVEEAHKRGMKVILDGVLPPKRDSKSTPPSMPTSARGLPPVSRHECMGITHHRRGGRAQLCDPLGFSRRTGCTGCAD